MLLPFLPCNKTLWPSCTERARYDIRTVTFDPLPFWARSFYAAVGFLAINQGCYIKPVDKMLTCCPARFAVSQLLSYLATCQTDTFQQQQRSNAHRLVHTWASVRAQSHAATLLASCGNRLNTETYRAIGNYYSTVTSSPAEQFNLERLISRTARCDGIHEFVKHN